MDWVVSLQRWLVRALNVLVALSVAGLAGIMALQVFLRYVLESSFLGIEEISALFGLWLYFMGLALVTARDQHVRGGLIQAALPPRVRRVLNGILLLLAGGICAYFFVLSLDYLAFLFEGNRRSTFLRWPSFLWAASLSLGLGLSTLLSVLRAIRPYQALPDG
jgi:TRAP-type C4-dicarboxylate transport system permease small subunit